MHRKMISLFVILLSMCAGGSAADTPHIVKRFHLYNQSGAIGPITVYTPKAGHGAMFRVNTFMLLTVNNNYQGSNFCGYLGFTDRVGPSQALATTNCVGTLYTGAFGQGTPVIPDEGGNPLTFSVSTTGTTSGAKYDVTIIVEEL